MPDHGEPPLVADMQPFQNRRQILRDRASFVCTYLPACPVEQIQIVGKRHRQTPLFEARALGIGWSAAASESSNGLNQVARGSGFIVLGLGRAGESLVPT